MAKKIAVLRKCRILHLGIDLDDAPWTGSLIRVLSGHRFSFVEHHGPNADDATASQLQLYRPEFPALDGRAGPARLNRMARRMRGYDLVLCHGDGAFAATMAHSLFVDAVSLPPLVHFHHALSGFEGGAMRRFRHRLGFARTSAVVAPTPQSAERVARAWLIGGNAAARLHVAAPVYPVPPKSVPKPDALPRMIKRKGERWIGIRAADVLSCGPDGAGALLRRIAGLDPHWRLVAFGSAQDTAALSAMAADVAADRLLTSTRIPGPEHAAGLFDMIAVRTDGAIPPALLPALAAGVPVLALGTELAPLLPGDMAALAFGADRLPQLAEQIAVLAQDDIRRAALGRAGREFAATQAKGADHIALIAQLLGDARFAP